MISRSSTVLYDKVLHPISRYATHRDSNPPPPPPPPPVFKHNSVPPSESYHNCASPT